MDEGGKVYVWTAIVLASFVTGVAGFLMVGQMMPMPLAAVFVIALSGVVGVCVGHLCHALTKKQGKCGPDS